VDGLLIFKSFFIKKINMEDSMMKKKINFGAEILLSVFLLVFGVITFSCNVNVNDGSSDEEIISLSAPLISPASGDYSEGKKTVSITNKNNAGEFFYTLDGTEPTAESPRYTEEFTVIGSKTIKAIIISGNSKSAVTTAKLSLNAGKTQSQLGVVSGKLALSANLTDSVKEQLKDSTIYIFSDDLPGVVKKSSIGGEFYFDGLDTSKSYSFYFTNKEPGVSYSRTATVTDDDGNPIVSTVITDVTPEEGAGLNLSEVELKPAGKISGSVKRFDVTGAEESDFSGITVYVPGTSYSAITDKTGNFTISGVPQGLLTIRASYAGYSSAEKENILLSGNSEDVPETVIDEPFELYFGKGIVKGSVVLSDVLDTSALSGIDIVLVDSTGSYTYSASTAKNGSYSIVDMYPGVYTAEISKDGYESATILDIKVVGAQVTSVPLTSLQVIGGSISGSVYLEGSKKQTGISVIAEKSASDGEKSLKYYAITNASGEYSFEAVSPGIYTITAAYPEYKNSVLENIAVSIGNELTNINLPQMSKTSYSISGKVILEGIASGFEGSIVLLRDSSSLKSVANTTTGTDGMFTIPDVEPGDYVLTVSHDGYLTSDGLVVNVGTVASVSVENIVLKNAKGSVSGTVTLESALDNAGINILLQSEDKNVTKTYSTVTDSTGHYALSGIEPGSWRVQATKSGFNNGYTDPFEISAGATAGPNTIELSISLRSIIGTVTLQGKTDYSGIRVTATKTTATTEIYSGLSNKEGTFALSGMTPGEYILSYSYEGYRSQTSSSVKLTEDSSITLDSIELTKATGKISGIANLEGCSDHSGILVSLVGTDYTYTTESDGSYEFTVPSGNYPGGVRFSRDDFQLTAKAETIPVLTDSTYGVLTVELKCLSVTVKGKVDLAGSDDDSNITVSVDGEENLSAVTDSEGNWQIQHVPLGYKTFRFTKTNVPEITCEKLVEAGLVLDIGTFEMIPNCATLKGFAYLTGMTDHAGITVTITTSGKDDIVVKTTSDGAFEATNILATTDGNKVPHTITFSKNGWDSTSITIDDLAPLEEREIGKSEEYKLVDTTAPVLNSVVLNSGANFTNTSKIHVELSSTEIGSGITKMAVQVIKTVDGVTSDIYPVNKPWQDYAVGFDYDLADLGTKIFSGNGSYEIVVTLKDKAGNESATNSKTITVTDLITSVSGVLTEDYLHWTKERSPYLVEADCLVGEDSTLVIDPGVEVRFAGNYSISVNGGIEARGTAEEKILFTSNCVNQETTYTETEWGEYYDENGDYQCGEHEVTKTGITTIYWNSIVVSGGSLSVNNKYTYVSGNIFEYCEFEYGSNALVANAGVYVKNCSFHDGKGVDSRYSGNNYCVKSTEGTSVFINNEFKNGLYLDYGSEELVENNYISGYLYKDSNGSFKNNTVESCNVYFLFNCTNVSMNKFINVSLELSYLYNSNLIITNNVFEDCSGTFVTTDTEYTSHKSYNLQGNYWGPSQTEELESKGKNANISFISDYYDNFNYTRIDYSNWLTEAPLNVGYLGDKFIGFDVSVDNVSSSTGGETQETDLTLSVPVYYSQNSITQIRSAQSLSELKNASWASYSEKINFTVDKEKLVDGYATIYVQVKDSEGNESSSAMVKLPYDSPVITCSIKDGTVYENPTENLKYTLTLKDEGEISRCTIYLNDIKLESYDNPGSPFESTLGTKYMVSGDYTLSITARDYAGNETTESYTFTIKNTSVDVSTLADSSWSTTTGQLLKDDRTVYLWHLDSSGSEANNPNGNLSSYTSATGGFGGGSASYIYTRDTIPLDVSSNEFTIEYWIKGSQVGDNPFIEIEKGKSFDCYSGFGYMNLYYQNSDSDVTSKNISLSRAPAADSEWHYVSMVYGKTYVAQYIDGILVSYTDGLSLTLYNNDNKLSMYALCVDAVDEIRISNAARSADEIKAYYDCAKEFLQ
jgi:hypothetical protein